MPKETKAYMCSVCGFKIYSKNRKPLQIIWENDWGLDITKFQLHVCTFHEVNAAEGFGIDKAPEMSEVNNK